jgi:hypothetical protein
LDLQVEGTGGAVMGNRVRPGAFFAPDNRWLWTFIRTDSPPEVKNEMPLQLAGSAELCAGAAPLSIVIHRSKWI